MESVEYKNLVWHDFANPSVDDIVFLQENFNLHPLAVEEFATPTYRARATKYPNCLFMSIHIPLYDTVEKTTYPGEIDIILTPTHLITGHRKEIYQVTNFLETLQKSEGKRRVYMSKTPSHIMYEVLNILLESCFPRLDHITKNIDDIETGIFGGKEREMVREISLIKRDILNFRRTMMPQRTILESITAQPGNVIAPDIKPYFHDLIGTNIRLWNMLESSKETIDSLEETNNSLFSQKLNTKMRVITIFSAVFIPMTLYANVLGINVVTPLADHPQGFLIHLGMMISISLATILAFRVTKWF